MRENLSIERLRRLSEATPEQLAAIDLILGLEKVEIRKGESGNGEQRQVPGMEFAEMLAGIHREIAAVRKDVQEMPGTVKEGLEQKAGWRRRLCLESDQSGVRRRTRSFGGGDVRGRMVRGGRFWCGAGGVPAGASGCVGGD